MDKTYNPQETEKEIYSLWPHIRLLYFMVYVHANEGRVSGVKKKAKYG